jgi:hypothetical protein
MSMKVADGGAKTEKVRVISSGFFVFDSDFEGLQRFGK